MRIEGAQVLQWVGLSLAGGLAVVFLITVFLSFRAAVTVGRAPDRMARTQMASLGGMIMAGSLLIASVQTPTTDLIAVSTAGLGALAIVYAARRRRF